jgi:thioredoxin 1
LSAVNYFDVTDETWAQVIEKTDKLVVVLFHSPVCPHCRALMPTFEALSKDYSARINFVKLNVDEQRRVADGYGVMGVPTIKFFCRGRPVSDIVGNLKREELMELFDRTLAVHDKCINTSTPIYSV